MGKILIVEDEPDVAEIIKMLVESKGYETEIALGGKEGLERIRKDKKYDLILLDIRMPEVTGRQILEIMKKEQIKIPVIVITAVAGALQIRSDLEARYQIDGFVSKPYLNRDLISEIERVLKKKKNTKEREG